MEEIEVLVYVLVNVVYQLCSRLSLSVSLVYLCISLCLSVCMRRKALRRFGELAVNIHPSISRDLRTAARPCGASGNWL